MPYASKTGRRYVRRRTRRARRPQKGILDYQVSLRSMYNQLKYIRSLVNVEYKKFDGAVASTVGTTPFLALAPCSVSQGDTDQQRNGNSIRLKSLLIKGQFLLNPSATTTQMCRMIVVMDNQQIGDTTPAFSDIIDSGFGNNIYAPLNNETVGRFTVLLDRVYSLQPNGDTLKSLYHYLKMDKHVRFNGPANTDIQKNGIYVYCVSNDNTNLPSLQLVSRTTFIDN